MTQITVQDGKVVMRDGQVGAGAGCCCDGECATDEECCACTYTIAQNFVDEAGRDAIVALCGECGGSVQVTNIGGGFFSVDCTTVVLNPDCSECPEFPECGQFDGPAEGRCCNGRCVRYDCCTTNSDCCYCEIAPGEGFVRAPCAIDGVPFNCANWGLSGTSVVGYCCDEECSPEECNPLP